MEQSPTWEANKFSASQEIPHILWNLNLRSFSVLQISLFKFLSALDWIIITIT